MSYSPRFLLLAVALATVACDRPEPTSLQDHVPNAAKAAPAAVSVTTWGLPLTEATEDAAVASDGSTYLAGITTSTPEAVDAFAVKIGPDGSLLWERVWDGPSQFFDDRAAAVASAPDGSVYVVGSTLGTGGDALLLKFGSDGTLLWQQTWGGASNDAAADVAVGADGSVYVTGATRSFGAGEMDIFALKLSPDGAIVWQKVLGTAGHEEGQGIAIAPDGTIVVAGVGPRVGGFFEFDALILKLDPAGNLLWQRAYAAGEQADARGGVAVAADGAIYVAGGFQGPSGSGFVNDALIFKLTGEGELVFDRTWGGPSGEFAEAISILADGRIAIAGSTDSYGTNGDAFLVTLQPSGRGSSGFTWGGAGLDNGNGVASAPDGTVSLGATVEQPPYVLERAPDRTSRARGTLSVSALPIGDAAGTVADAGGVATSPGGSTTYAGGWDAAVVRIIP